MVIQAQPITTLKIPKTKIKGVERATSQHRFTTCAALKLNNLKGRHRAFGLGFCELEYSFEFRNGLIAFLSTEFGHACYNNCERACQFGGPSSRFITWNIKPVHFTSLKYLFRSSITGMTELLRTYTLRKLLCDEAHQNLLSGIKRYKIH